MCPKTAFVLCVSLCVQAHAALTINEFHYDNTGSDTGEFIEVVSDGAVGSLSDVVIHLYNGSNGTVYGFFGLDQFTYDGTLADGKDYYTYDVTLQNGPDAIALVVSGTVVEFLSYEGAFQATNGPASGMDSVDIGVMEPTSTSVGSSLQRVSFTDAWQLIDGVNTKGQVNTGNPVIPVPGSGLLLLVGLGVVRSKAVHRALSVL